MNFMVFGAGAIGTYIGGSLIVGGNRVVFLETPEMAARISKSGLGLKIQEKVFKFESPTVAGSLEECLALGPYEAAIFAIKSFDTDSALTEIGLHLREIPPVLCLQNGVENEEKIARVLGEDRVIAGTVTSAIGRLPSGEVVLERLRGVGIAGSTSLIEKILTAFNQSGLNGKAFASARAMKWSKMLTNLISNASSAILKMPPAEVFSDPDLYRMEIEQLRETLLVMDAMGCPIVNLPGTPVQLLAAAARYLPLKFSQPLLRKAVGSGRGAKMPSLYLDLHSGRGKSEVEYLNGAVVRYGEMLGIPTPVNRLLYETLARMVAGEIPLDEFSQHPARLIQLWHKQMSNSLKPV